ncbi:MAG: nucleotide exchange factor GrpE [Pirellulales bacterium]|jgi:molecular chaperone GrpE
MNDQPEDDAFEDIDDRDDAGSEAAEAASDAGDRLQVAEDRALRLQAELDNVRKRMRREFDDAHRYREIDVLRDLLPVHDNMLRAIEAAEKASDVESLLSGFRMLSQQIEKLLEDHGCKLIATEGVAFDPAVHDAVLQQAIPGVEPGRVVGVASRGYSLHDRVVRPAQVIVAKHSEE